METQTRLSRPRWRRLIQLVAAAVANLAQAFGQAGAPSPAPQAIQLPLSGRTATQNGSVNSIQTSIPGVTSSVNTLNSSVQVQGGRH